MHETIGQKVPAMSESEIEAQADRFRTLIGCLGPIQSIKVIEHVLPRIFDEFCWEPIDDDELVGDFARAWPDRMLIRMTDSVYHGAWEGDGACNHILAHEIGHFVLHRNVDSSFALAKAIPQYDSIFNSEWQADTFADYFLMPTADVKATCCSIEDIEKRYCASKRDAERRHQKVFGAYTSKNIDSKVEVIKGQLQLALDFQTKG